MSHKYRRRKKRPTSWKINPRWEKAYQFILLIDPNQYKIIKPGPFISK